MIERFSASGGSYRIFSQPQIDDFVAESIVPFDELLVHSQNKHCKRGKEGYRDSEEAAVELFELLKEDLRLPCEFVRRMRGGILVWKHFSAIGSACTNAQMISTCM